MSTDKKTKIITSALIYVNNLPHLGNITGCVLSSDVYYKFCKMMGQDCIHICGTDEHGSTTEIRALELQIHPKELCEIMSKQHKEIYDWFDIEFTYFGRTSVTEGHVEMVQDIFSQIYKNGYFSEVEDVQYYCKECSMFLADRYVKGVCYGCKSDKARGDQCDECGKVNRGADLKDPRCSICSKEPEKRRTKHLHINLDTLKDKINNFYLNNSTGWSENAKDITKQWLNLDLHPRSMTRDLKFKWGVPVPLSGYEDKVFYVWFDAPIAYFTFAKKVYKERFNDVIRDKNTSIYQFMGKDNVPFHSIIFPGMLIAADDNYRLVNHISSTEYLMYEGDKFSKSRGVGIFGGDLLGNKKGESCYWRFYLMKIRPETKDSNFSHSDFVASVNSDLVNNYGNFVNRVLKYIKSKMNGSICYELCAADEELICILNHKVEKYIDCMERCEIRNGLRIVLDVSRLGNEYLRRSFSEEAKYGKESDKHRNSVFSVSVSIVLLLSYLTFPFMPKTSEKILKLINKKKDEFTGKLVLLENGHKIGDDITPLFKTMV